MADRIVISEGMPQLGDGIRKFRLEAFGRIVAALPWFNSNVLHKVYLNVFEEAIAAGAFDQLFLSWLDRVPELKPFQTYAVRSISCADLLHSPAIKRLTANVFVMRNEARTKLRKELTGTLKKSIAEFLLLYAEECEDHILSKKYREAFVIEANSILNPESEARRIIQHIADQASQEVLHQDQIKDSISYYLDYIKSNHSNNPGLLKQFQSLEHLVKGEYSKLKTADADAKGNSFKMQVPTSLKKEILQHIQIESERFSGRQLMALCVGIDNYPQGLTGQVEQAQTVLDYLGVYAYPHKIHTLNLFKNESATKRAIIERIEYFISEIQTGDVFFLYLAGFRQTFSLREKTRISSVKNEHTSFVCYHNPEGGGMPLLALDELLYLAGQVTEKGGRATITIDWKGPEYPKWPTHFSERDFLFAEEFFSSELDYKSFIPDSDTFLWHTNPSGQLTTGANQFTHNVLRELKRRTDHTLTSLSTRLSFSSQPIEQVVQKQQLNHPEPSTQPPTFKLMGKVLTDDPFLFGILEEDLNRKIQLALNQKMDAGLEVDGVWDEPMNKVIHNYRLENNLRPSEELDRGVIQHLLKEEEEKGPDIWVRVIGTGTKSYAKYPVLDEASKLVGQQLAKAGFGLITSGYSGVDEATGRAFVNALEEEGKDSKAFFKIIITDKNSQSNDLFDKANIIDERDQSQGLVSKINWSQRKYKIFHSDALILIGGGLGTRRTAYAAIDEKIPVFPLVATGLTAKNVFNSKKWQEASAFYYLDSHKFDPANFVHHSDNLEETVGYIIKTLSGTASTVTFLEEAYNDLLPNYCLITNKPTFSSKKEGQLEQPLVGGLLVYQRFLLTTSAGIKEISDVDLKDIRFAVDQADMIIQALPNKVFLNYGLLGFSIVQVNGARDYESRPISLEKLTDLERGQKVGIIQPRSLAGNPVTFIRSEINDSDSDFFFVKNGNASGSSHGCIVFDENRTILGISVGREDGDDYKTMRCIKTQSIISVLKETGIYDSVISHNQSIVGLDMSIKQLIHLLSTINLSPDIIIKVCNEAGINTHFIDFSGSPTEMWFNVIQEAEKTNLFYPLIELLNNNYTLPKEVKDAFQRLEKPSFRRLRKELSKLYSNTQEIMVIAEDSGIDHGNIAWKGSIERVWYQVLRELNKRNKLLNLIELVQEEYPNNKEIQSIKEELLAEIEKNDADKTVYFSYPRQNNNEGNKHFGFVKTFGAILEGENLEPSLNEIKRIVVANQLPPDSSSINLMVLVLNDAYFKSTLCLKEFWDYLKSDPTESLNRFIPVLLDDLDVYDEEYWDNLKAFWTKRQRTRTKHPNQSTDDDIADNFERIADYLKEIISANQSLNSESSQEEIIRSIIAKLSNDQPTQAKSRNMNRGSFNDESAQKGPVRDPFAKTNHLLAIGINDYPESIGRLNNAVRDVKEFSNILTTQYGFDHVEMLLNEEATKEEIIETFDKMIKDLTEDDNLVVYYAGHGQLFQNRGYWIPHDAEIDKRHTYISNYEILGLMSDVEAHHVIMIVDSCFSGALLSHERNTAAERFYEMPSRWVISSGQIEPVDDGPVGHYSPFAKSLFTQLRNYPKDLLSLSQLWINMREGIVANAKQTPSCEPVRDVGHQGGEYYFIKPGATSTPEPLPVSVEDVVATGPVKKINIPKEPVSALEIRTSEALKKAMKKELLEGNTASALQLSLDHLNETSEYVNIAILRMGNLRRLERDINSGVAMNEAQQLARINQAVNYIINNIEEEDMK